MDDSIILMEKKDELKEVKNKIEKFITEKLYLSFNSKTNIFKSKQGVNFCGYKINEYRLKLRDRGKRKLKLRIKKLKQKVKTGEITSHEAKRYLAGHIGYIKWADIYNLSNKLFYIEDAFNVKNID